MPLLIGYLRQYGPREYLLMLTVAAVCGLGVATLINLSAGGDAGEALLKPKPQIDANSPRRLTTRVYSPAHEARRASRQHAPVRHHRRARPPVETSAPPPIAQTPAPQRQEPLVEPKPAPIAPTPVVRRPAPAPTPTESSGGAKRGGSVDFDDSG
jgi:hypothetical protein